MQTARKYSALMHYTVSGNDSVKGRNKQNILLPEILVTIVILLIVVLVIILDVCDDIRRSIAALGDDGWQFIQKYSLHLSLK